MGKGKKRRQLAAETGTEAREVEVFEQKASISKQSLNHRLGMGQGSKQRRRKAEEKEAAARMDEKNPVGYAKDITKEIAECERIVEFARQVEEGVHPRVKIPSHLHHLIERARLDPSKIRFAANYYSVLRVQPHVKQDAITRAYEDRWNNCSPISPSEDAIRKWKSGDPRIVHKVEKDWKRVQIAFKIISDPDLRARYDAGRQRFSSDKNDTFGVQPDSSLEAKEAERVNLTLAAETEREWELATTGEQIPAVEQRSQQHALPVDRRVPQPEAKIKYEVLSLPPFRRNIHRTPLPSGEKSRGLEIKREQLSEREKHMQRSQLLNAELDRQQEVSRNLVPIHGYSNYVRNPYVAASKIQRPTVKREREESD